MPPSIFGGGGGGWPLTNYGGYLSIQLHTCPVIIIFPPQRWWTHYAAHSTHTPGEGKKRSNKNWIFIIYSILHTQPPGPRVLLPGYRAWSIVSIGICVYICIK